MESRQVLPPIRTIAHPGPVLQPRVLAQASEPVAEWRLVVPAGADLLDGIGRALAARGVTSAAVRVGGGALAAVTYVTGVPDPTGYRIATHSAANALGGPALLVSGAAILGPDDAGRARVHCHAVFVDAAGEPRSGHLVPGGCPAGPGGIVAFATPTGRAGFVTRFDPETNFPIFHPGEEPEEPEEP